MLSGKLSFQNYKTLKKKKCFKWDVKMSHVKMNENNLQTKTWMETKMKNK